MFTVACLALPEERSIQAKSKNKYLFCTICVTFNMCNGIHLICLYFVGGRQFCFIFPFENVDMRIAYVFKRIYFKKSLCICNWSYLTHFLVVMLNGMIKVGSIVVLMMISSRNYSHYRCLYILSRHLPFSLKCFPAVMIVVVDYQDPLVILLKLLWKL